MEVKTSELGQTKAIILRHLECFKIATFWHGSIFAHGHFDINDMMRKIFFLKIRQCRFIDGTTRTVPKP